MEDKKIFPQLSMATEADLANKPIKLDGQKVIFVKRASLMPTEVVNLKDIKTTGND
jgi:hypothetical protein